MSRKIQTSVCNVEADARSDSMQQRSRLAKIVSHGGDSPASRDKILKSIADTVLRKSKVIKSSNFDLIGTEDLARMAELYDEHFFAGMCLDLAKRDGIRFRWSRRMTSAGGKTTRTVWPATPSAPSRTEYEITLSSSLLFQTFQDDSKLARVCGRSCTNRMEAMQRILEHEMIHLIEMLVWVDSNCAAGRFQNIASRFFGHTEHRHELVTQRERASKSFNIRIGNRVQFRFEGRVLKGLVNRITRRATVLVEDREGIPFSDGRRYRKYYVPIAKLDRIS